MPTELPQDLQQIVHDAIRSGHYAGEQDVIRDALTRLKQVISSTVDEPTQKTKISRQDLVEQTPLSPDDLNQQLLAAGLLLQLPDPVEDIDDDDEPPVKILGEPLSETIIRERR